MTFRCFTIGCVTTLLLAATIVIQAKPVPVYVLTSLDRVKQIAIATILYANDHGRLPAASSLRVALRPYVPDVNALLAAPGAPKGSVSYFLDPRLSGKKWSAVTHPERTALILAGTADTVAFNSAGKTPLGYADGIGRWADRATVAKARTTPLK